MEKILISRCLLGHAVRYDGGASGPFDQVTMWQAEGRVVAICPEVAGGLPTPRPAAEIAGGQGVDVWEGRAQVLTAEGEDFSAAFLDGARQALALVQRHNIRIAVLKEGSPSCGSGYVYDGHFAGRRQPGVGVTAQLLRGAGLYVFSEHQWAEAAAFLAELEAGDAGRGG